MEWKNEGPIPDQRIFESVQPLFKTGEWRQVSGPRTQEVATKFAHMHDCEFGVMACNGTVILPIVLRALGIGEHDKVILPAYNFYAYADCVTQVGATPLFIDIHLDNPTLAAELVQNRIDPTVKAIVAVHIDSALADLAALREICDLHGIYLLEDCAQAHGAIYGKAKVGSWGTAGLFSFGHSKLLTAGHGGAIITHDAELYEKCYALVNRGRDPAGKLNRFQLVGSNYQMTELEAAMLLPQLDMLEDLAQQREEIMRFFDAQIALIDEFIPIQHFVPTVRRSHLRYSFFYRARSKISLEALIEYAHSLDIPYIKGYSSVSEEKRFFGTYTTDEQFPCALNAQNALISIYHHTFFRGESFWQEAFQQMREFLARQR